MMFDILDFIDSPDIREYNRDTVFTPAQKAVLIVSSMAAGLENKTEALQFLTDTYPDEKEFAAKGQVADEFGDAEGRMRELVIWKLQEYKKMLDGRYASDPYIFAAQIYERESESCGCDRLNGFEYFGSYADAYEWLRSEKQEYAEDDDLKRVVLWGEIERHAVSQDSTPSGQEKIVYVFNHELVLVNAYFQCGYGDGEMTDEEDRDNDVLWDNLFVAVPAPFRDGDIVKSETVCSETCYGVLSTGEKSAGGQNEWWQYGSLYDMHDMYVRLDSYYPDGHGGRFGWDHVPVMSLSYCKEGEIPRGIVAIRLISMVRKGMLDCYEVLCNFSWGRDDFEKYLRTVLDVPEKSDAET